MNNAIFLLCLNLMLLPSNIKASEFDCYTVIIEIEDTLTVNLISHSHCDCSVGFEGDGYVIYQSNYLQQKATILWGESILEQCMTKYLLTDIDHDKRNEVLTLFQDESNIWGYFHQFTIDSSYSVTVNTFPIPYLFTEDLVLSELVVFNSDNSITIKGTTYDNQENLTIRYSRTLDSIIIK